MSPCAACDYTDNGWCPCECHEETDGLLHDHDYCCRCYDEDDRAQRIIEDVLDGSYEGEITIPRIPFLDPADARSIARALVGVLQHEDVI